MKEIETEGKTVTIAVEAGLTQLGLRRDQVEVQVLEEGSAGFLGLGAKPARVRIREKRWGHEEETAAESRPAGTPLDPAGRGEGSKAAPRGPAPERGERTRGAAREENRDSTRRPPAAKAPPRAKTPRRPARPAGAETRPAGEAAPRGDPATPRGATREENDNATPRGSRPAPPPPGGPAIPPGATRGENDNATSAALPARESARAPQELAEPGAACAVARELLDEIFRLAGIGDAAVECRWDSDQERVVAEVKSADAGLIIGKGGRTLEALQFLVTVIAGRKLGVPTAIQVETEGYWKKIETRVLAEAERALAQVKSTGNPYRFEPMEPALRRLVHRRLAEDGSVETASEGEGPWRKVVVRPRR